MAVLNAVPNSKLLLKSKNLGEQVECERVRNLFQDLGLTPERLEMRGHSPSVEEHLAAYSDVDIALDTFPYTGCTTTADALWMGVPVLTVAGESMVSRQAAAVLRGVGAPSGSVITKLNLWRGPWSWPKMTIAYMKYGYSNAGKWSKVSCSTILDLPTAWRKPFRYWWLRWLQQQNWPTETKQKAWSRHNRPEDFAPLTPVLNSVYKRLPLWLGSLPDTERQHMESQGKRVIPIQSLKPWGKAVTLFANEHPGKVLAWLETGANEDEQRWWKYIYPQLVWEPKGPLAKQ